MKANSEMSGGMHPPGLSQGEGFGGIGDAMRCYQEMAKVLRRLGEIRDTVEGDGINVEMYVKEMANTLMDLTRATGRMFEQEHLRFISMVTAANGRGVGGGQGAPRGIMEHK